MAIDILILVIVVVGGVIGFNKGIVSQVGQIVAVVAGVISARIFGEGLADMISGAGAPGAVDTVSGYGVAFLAAYCLAWLVVRMVRKVFHTVHLGIVDRLAGAAFKIAQWSLLLSLAINFVLLVSGDDDRLHDQGAPWREAVVKFAPATLGYLSEMVQEHNKEADKNVNVRNDEDDR